MKKNILFTCVLLCILGLIKKNDCVVFPNVTEEQIEKYETQNNEENLKQALKRQPANSDLLFRLGRYYFETAIEIRANDPSRGYQVYLDKAREQFDKVLKSDQNYLNAKRGIGKIDFIENKYQHAIQMYTAVLDKYPLDFEALYMIGAIYEKVGDFDKVKIYFDKAKQVAATNEKIKNTLEYKTIMNYYKGKESRP